MATTIRVSSGRPSRSRLLSMVSESQAGPGKRLRLIGAAEKVAFHIVHIPVRQSRGLLLHPAERQILPPGRNAAVTAALRLRLTHHNRLKHKDFISTAAWPGPC